MLARAAQCHLSYLSRLQCPASSAAMSICAHRHAFLAIEIPKTNRARTLEGDALDRTFHVDGQVRVRHGQLQVTDRSRATAIAFRRRLIDAAAGLPLAVEVMSVGDAVFLTGLHEATDQGLLRIGDVGNTERPFGAVPVALDILERPARAALFVRPAIAIRGMTMGEHFGIDRTAAADQPCLRAGDFSVIRVLCGAVVRWRSSSQPASSRSTRASGFSLSRSASTQPAHPPPTIT